MPKRGLAMTADDGPTALESGSSGEGHGKPATTRRTLTPELAALLKHWRSRSGYSQRRLAKAVGATSSGYVCNLEAGRRAPSIARAIALAEVLRLSRPEASRLLDEASP